jgi:hypothetical protein
MTDMTNDASVISAMPKRMCFHGAGEGFCRDIQMSSVLNYPGHILYLDS